MDTSAQDLVQPSISEPGPPLSPPVAETITPKKSVFEKIWRIFYLATLTVGVLALVYYLFLQPMKVSGQNPVDPFVVGQQIFSERLSYLYREPKVGEAIIFNRQSDGTNYNGNYFGIIAKINEQDNIKTYEVISTKTQQDPWIISNDKIIARIYYPVVNRSLLTQPSLPPIANADRKTYTYQELTFEYPNDWSLRTDKITAVLPPEVKVGEEFPSINFYAIDNPQNLTIQEYMEEASKEGMAPNLYSPSAREMIINGMQGYYQQNQSCEPLACDIFTIPFNKKIYDITIVYSEIESQKLIEQQNKLRPIFNQILTSLKFGSSAIDDWQTYTNTEYGFSLKYPTNFLVEKVEPAGYREFGITFTNKNAQESLQIEVVGNTKVNYDQISKSYHNNDTSWSNNPSVQYTENLKTTIANLNAKTFKSIVYSPVEDNSSIETTYFFVDSQTHNFIIKYGRPLEENGTQDDLLSSNQILSTLKFTN